MNMLNDNIQKFPKKVTWYILPKIYIMNYQDWIIYSDSISYRSG